MEEIWKDITGYEGYYQVSNMGNVRSVDRVVFNSKNNAYHKIKGKNRAFSIRKKGYLGVYLMKEGKGKSFLVHRLVAEAFIPNPLKLPQINHKDENKQNNCAENLEWCTNKYNANYGDRNRKHSITQTNNTHHQKPVLCVETGELYANSKDVQRRTGNWAANIRKACGNNMRIGGYHWKWISNEEYEERLRNEQ